MPSISVPREITGFPEPQRANHAVGIPETPQDSCQVLRSLDLLEAKLAKAEDLVDHLLDHVLVLLDLGDDFGLEEFEPLRLHGAGRRRRDGGGLCLRLGCEQKGKGEGGDETHAGFLLQEVQ
jgi:hypothetical protein